MYNYFLLVGILRSFDVDAKTFVIEMVENRQTINYTLSYKETERQDEDLFNHEEPAVNKLEQSMNRPLGIRGRVSLRNDGGFDLIPTHLKKFE